MAAELSEEEVKRVAAALRTAIRLSGVSNRQIERELGISTGYLTRILGGRVELRLAHVLAVCQVIGLPVGNFFAALFPSSEATGAESHGQPAQRRDLKNLVRELRQELDELDALLGLREDAG